MEKSGKGGKRNKADYEKRENEQRVEVKLDEEEKEEEENFLKFSVLYRLRSTFLR